MRLKSCLVIQHSLMGALLTEFFSTVLVKLKKLKGDVEDGYLILRNNLRVAISSRKVHTRLIPSSSQALSERTFLRFEGVRLGYRS